MSDRDDEDDAFLMLAGLANGGGGSNGAVEEADDAKNNAAAAAALTDLLMLADEVDSTGPTNSAPSARVASTTTIATEPGALQQSQQQPHRRGPAPVPGTPEKKAPAARGGGQVAPQTARSAGGIGIMRAPTQGEESGPGADAAKKSEPIEEQLSGIYIAHRQAAFHQLKVVFCEYKFRSIPHALQLAAQGGSGGSVVGGTPQQDKMWCTIGVVTRKNDPKHGSSGGGFGIVTLWDMVPDQAPATLHGAASSSGGGGGGTHEMGLMLKGAAFEQHFMRMVVGDVLCVCGADALPPKQGSSSMLFSVKNSPEVKPLGRCLDLSTCVATTRSGEKCSQKVNTRAMKYCSYHYSQALQEAKKDAMKSARMKSAPVQGARKGNSVVLAGSGIPGAQQTVPRTGTGVMSCMGVQVAQQTKYPLAHLYEKKPPAAPTAIPSRGGPAPVPVQSGKLVGAQSVAPIPAPSRAPSKVVTASPTTPAHQERPDFAAFQEKMAKQRSSCAVGLPIAAPPVGAPTKTTATTMRSSSPAVPHRNAQCAQQPMTTRPSMTTAAPSLPSSRSSAALIAHQQQQQLLSKSTLSKRETFVATRGKQVVNSQGLQASMDKVANVGIEGVTDRPLMPSQLNSSLALGVKATGPAGAPAQTARGVGARGRQVLGAAVNQLAAEVQTKKEQEALRGVLPSQLQQTGVKRAAPSESPGPTRPAPSLSSQNLMMNGMSASGVAAVPRASSMASTTFTTMSTMTTTAEAQRNKLGSAVAGTGATLKVTKDPQFAPLQPQRQRGAHGSVSTPQSTTGCRIVVPGGGGGGDVADSSATGKPRSMLAHMMGLQNTDIKKAAQEATSTNDDLRKEVNRQRFESHLDNLEKIDNAVVALQGIMEQDVDAFYCFTCRKFFWHYPRPCAEAGHRIEKQKTKKRHYTCDNCNYKMPHLGELPPTDKCPRCTASKGWTHSHAAPEHTLNVSRFEKDDGDATAPP